MGSPAVAVGEVVGHYRILKRVGEGGMELKFLSGNSLNDASSHRRFRKEALALAKLNHPNIAVLGSRPGCMISIRKGTSISR
jgi:hypothetical protein